MSDMTSVEEGYGFKGGGCSIISGVTYEIR
jgi:hypothetical protein